MNYTLFAYLSFFAFLFYLFLIFFILIKKPEAKISWVVSLFLFCLGFWSFSHAFVYNTALTEETASLWYKINSFGWIAFSPFFIWFIVLFTKFKKLYKSKIFLILIFLPAVLLIYKQWQGDLFAEFVLHSYGWTYVWDHTVWTYLYYAYYSVLLILALFILIKFARETKQKERAKQSRILIYTTLISVLIGSALNIVLPQLGIYSIPQLAPFTTLIWAVGIVYVMIRYNFLDITPAYAAEKIVETMLEALILLDLNGKIVLVNNSALNLLGYSEQEDLLNKSVDVIFSKKDTDTKLIRKISRGEKVVDYNISVKKKNNQIVPAIFSSSPFVNKFGQLTGVICVARDVSSLRKAEKSLEHKIKELKFSKKDLKQAYEKVAQEQEKVSAIISNFIDPIILIDKEGKVSFLNPAAENFLGISPDAIGTPIVKKDNFSLVNFKKIIGVNFDITKEREEKDDLGEYEEEAIFHNDNKEVNYRIKTLPVIESNGVYLGTMKIFYDVTREKNIDKMKTEFISVAAHQLRTPLSAVKWIIKMVLEGDSGPLTEEQRRLLLKTYKSNERIIQLVNDMLYVARIEEGRFDYSFKKLDFVSVLNEILDEFGQRIKNKNLNLEIKKPKKIPRIEGDAEKIKIVLKNLLDNAIKYTPENGKVEIKLKAKKERLEAEIKDNGMGIPREQQQKVFTKFFRAQNAIKIQTEGNGLGLFIVKNIVEAHHGTIMFSSQEGKGTTVAINFPYKQKKNRK